MHHRRSHRQNIARIILQHLLHLILPMAPLMHPHHTRRRFGIHRIVKSRQRAAEIREGGDPEVAVGVWGDVVEGVGYLYCIDLFDLVVLLEFVDAEISGKGTRHVEEAVFTQSEAVGKADPDVHAFAFRVFVAVGDGSVTYDLADLVAETNFILSVVVGEVEGSITQRSDIIRGGNLLMRIRLHKFDLLSLWIDLEELNCGVSSHLRLIGQGSSGDVEGRPIVDEVELDVIGFVDAGETDKVEVALAWSFEDAVFEAHADGFVDAHGDEFVFLAGA